jgi:hypothetical protein
VSGEQVGGRRKHLKHQLSSCLTSSSGDICGAELIDEKFQNLIASKVGEAYFRIPFEHRERMIRDFIVNIKRGFAYEPGDVNKKLTIELRGVADNLERGIRQEKIPFDR